MRKTESNRWAEAFADEWLSLIASRANFLDLLDWAHELYPQDHRLDAATVARREFAMLRPSRAPLALAPTGLDGTAAPPR